MNRQDKKSSKELHSGDYVRMYERKPISRISRLIHGMKLDPSTRLVDFACGNAMLLEEVHDKVLHYTGVDFSEDFIVAAKRRAERLHARNSEFHCEDIIAFCHQHPDSFDVATALDFTEHVSDADLLPILTAIRDSLKLGGRLYLHTPNLDFFLERMRDAGFILRQRPEHIAVRNLDDNVALLEQAGFAHEYIWASLLPHYNVLRAVHTFRHLPLIGGYFEARIFIECRK